MHRKSQCAWTAACLAGVLLAALLGCAPPPAADDAESAIRRGDHARAAQLLRVPAERGDAQAQTNLGLLYFYGLGVPRDLQQSLLWTRKAAEAGKPKAQANLALLYVNGDGVAQSDRHAAPWGQ